jgi:antitoxin (DNA-binding transcriptional repressor) of toxin-antitoxin stability system
VKVTASKLRENIYGILDQVLETGTPVEVIRKGKVLRIVPEQKPDKLSRLKKRDYLVGDPEDIVHMDWSSEWDELKNLK